MKINIAYAPDDKYVNQTVVSMKSALEHNSDVEFVILYSVLSDENIKKLNEVGGEIRFVKMDEAEFADLTLCDWVTVQAWFRTALPKVCPDLDRVLYLDCDTFVRGNLEEFFVLDIDGKYLAGVKDVWGVSKYVKRLGMQSDVYVNSGMLLLNCNYCRENKFFENVVDFAKNNAKIIEFCDQDAINKVADIEKMVVHPKYNFMDTWWRNGYYEFEGKEEEEYLEAKENPVIAHLTGPKPAFKGCGNKFKDEWWECAKKTTIYDELLKDYENSRELVKKEPLLRQIFSVKNEYNGKTKTKILRILGLKIKLK